MSVPRCVPPSTEPVESPLCAEKPLEGHNGQPPPLCARAVIGSRARTEASAKTVSVRTSRTPYASSDRICAATGGEPLCRRDRSIPAERREEREESGRVRRIPAAERRSGTRKARRLLPAADRALPEDRRPDRGRTANRDDRARRSERAYRARNAPQTRRSLPDNPGTIRSPHAASPAPSADSRRRQEPQTDAPSDIPADRACRPGSTRRRARSTPEGSESPSAAAISICVCIGVARSSYEEYTARYDTIVPCSVETTRAGVYKTRCSRVKLSPACWSAAHHTPIPSSGEGVFLRPRTLW
jgi:hypothetical protein